MVGSIVITIKTPDYRSFIPSMILLGVNEDISSYAAYFLTDNQLYIFVTENELISSMITKFSMGFGCILFIGCMFTLLWDKVYCNIIYIPLEKLPICLFYLHLIAQIGAMIMGLYSNIEEYYTIALFDGDAGDGGGSSSGEAPTGGPAGGPSGNGEDPSNNSSGGKTGSSGDDDKDPSKSSNNNNTRPDNANIGDCVHE
jgi:hypothetical protein